MADTNELLDLLADYPDAFQDPEEPQDTEIVNDEDREPEPNQGCRGGSCDV